MVSAQVCSRKNQSIERNNYAMIQESEDSNEFYKEDKLVRILSHTVAENFPLVRRQICIYTSSFN